MKIEILFFKKKGEAEKYSNFICGTFFQFLLRSFWIFAESNVFYGIDQPPVFLIEFFSDHQVCGANVQIAANQLQVHSFTV